MRIIFLGLLCLVADYGWIGGASASSQAPSASSLAPPQGRTSAAGPATNTGGGKIRDWMDAIFDTCCTKREGAPWEVAALEHPCSIDAWNWRKILGEQWPAGQTLQAVHGCFYPEEADPNRDGAPRLDMVLPFDNAVWVRYHPKARHLIWSTDPMPSPAMAQRMKYKRKMDKERAEGMEE